MRLDRLGDRGGDRAAVSRPMDAGPHEGALETSDRGEPAPARALAEFESDESGPPSGVVAFELAREFEQLLGWPGNRPTTRAIIGGQSLAIGAAGQPPDVPDRAIGDGQFRRDQSQRESLLATTDDLLTERDRERMRHGSRLRSLGNRVQLLTKVDLTHAYS